MSQLITDHFHLWEQGAGNYHMGYTGFEFVRGIEGDNWITDPIDFPCPEGDRRGKNERHFRNMATFRRNEEDYFPARVFRRAADWIERNRSHEDFYLHIDCFAPHEPWDPPAHLLERFWPDGYEVDFAWSAGAPYAPWKDHMTRQQMEFARARYAANVVLTDRWLGVLLDKLDEHRRCEDTLVIFTTDHGTYNGDHGRMGKLQTHQHDACAHIPLIIAHPEHAQGETRDHLVQLVDLYPPTLAALGCSPPGTPRERPLHGVNPLPVIEDARTPTRDYAVAGMFGGSVTITDGRWILHQAPVAGNEPLHWYGHALAHFIGYDLGPYENGRRRVRNALPALAQQPTWLSDKAADPNELENLAEGRPEPRRAMEAALREKLEALQAPDEQLTRLGLR